MAFINTNNQSKFDELKISLATPEQIRSWSRGEVKKPETINHRSFKPEQDGLFSEKIFGPVKDFECSCGKYKKMRFKGIVCERCGVEVTRAAVRRERMGHIELATPVSHIWYLKGSPSRLHYLLDIPAKELESVIYFAKSIVTKVKQEDIAADKDELKEELETEIQQLNAEYDEEITRFTEMIAAQEAGSIEKFEFSPKEAAREIEDIKAERDERITLRRKSLDLLLTMKPGDLIESDTLFREMVSNYGEFTGSNRSGRLSYFTGGMGAEAIRELLDEIDLSVLEQELRVQLQKAKGAKRDELLKRLKVVISFIKSSNHPRNMILEVLPINPPDLRPMVPLDGGRFATSDLNDLYRRVIIRNNRLRRLQELSAPAIIINNEKRMLQEAVDTLLDNGRRGRPVLTSNSRKYKSLSNLLSKKQGIFRQNLLGKRVDYSGRSVIVVGPQLKLHQCGLPKPMALELFKPFVVSRLVEHGYAANVDIAKTMVERGTAIEMWDVLEEVILEHPVLLNRAPTLHRLGIQAFEPVLVEGKAILLHPLVCTAFNADFDGDQMAVHVPLSAEAQAEARVLMLSSNNIKSPSNGKPLTVPTQDMIIGLFYLTSARDGFPGEGSTFLSFTDAETAYRAKSGADLQAKIEVRLPADTAVIGEDGKSSEMKAGERLATTIGRIIFNSALPNDHAFVNYVLNKPSISKLVEDACEKYSTTQMESILDSIKAMGFHFATLAGVTVSVYDATVPDNKEQILKAADKEVAAINNGYEEGKYTEAERRKNVVDVWNKANDDVGNAMAENFDPFNPIYMMATSGARGNIKQIRQLAGMRGLMSNPKGDIIDRPIKANFREGLSVLEYFISTHGARKGLADTALRTADSGYLTRRLVDVAQDVIVHSEDCGTDRGVDEKLLVGDGKPNVHLIGRCVQGDVVSTKSKKVLLASGGYIESAAQLQTYIDEGLETIKIRSTLTCAEQRGICQKCYGWDLSSSLPVNIGTAVGIIAAQSIGEPGTQLTMRTFHTGGVAGEDITHGLPRVTEIFEARAPKGLAILAEIDGTLSIKTKDGKALLSLSNKKGQAKEYILSSNAQILPGLKDGDAIARGQQLSRGSIYPKELLKLTDEQTTMRYIIDQVQNVYINQGVEINDKHIEIIARQMLRRVSVTDPGSSLLLPSEELSFEQFNRAVAEAKETGTEAPKAAQLLLGITKASLATDSFMSAASFQETTKVLTDAAIEGKTDKLLGLKESVIIGKAIPAGTGVSTYSNVKVNFRGEPIEAEYSSFEELPKNAPTILQDIEQKMPKPTLWPPKPGDYSEISEIFLKGQINSDLLSFEDAQLYISDDLGVAQRWSNKFASAGIEKVGQLVGKSEDDLLQISGIGLAAISELKSGLEQHNLLHVLEPENFLGIGAMDVMGNLSPSDEFAQAATEALAAGENEVAVDEEGNVLIG